MTFIVFVVGFWFLKLTFFNLSWSFLSFDTSDTSKSTTPESWEQDLYYRIIYSVDYNYFNYQTFFKLNHLHLIDWFITYFSADWRTVGVSFGPYICSKLTITIFYWINHCTWSELMFKLNLFSIISMKHACWLFFYSIRFANVY